MEYKVVADKFITDAFRVEADDQEYSYHTIFLRTDAEARAHAYADLKNRQQQPAEVPVPTPANYLTYGEIRAITDKIDRTVQTLIRAAIVDPDQKAAVEHLFSKSYSQALDDIWVRTFRDRSFDSDNVCSIAGIADTSIY